MVIACDPCIVTSWLEASTLCALTKIFVYSFIIAELNLTFYAK